MGNFRALPWQKVGGRVVRTCLDRTGFRAANRGFDGCQVTKTPFAILWICLAVVSAGCGGTPVSELADQLQDEDHAVRYAAIKKLEKYGPESAEALDALSKALSDPSKKVRYRSAKTLSKIGIGAEPAAEAMKEALKGADSETRYYLVKALANIEDAAVIAVGELTDILAQDQEARIRLYAAKALGKIGTEARSAIPVLENAKNDSDPKVRKAVSDALKKVKK